MAQYQEQTVQGQVWQRCYAIHITNPLGGQATITFEEEKVMTVDSEVIKNPTGLCRKRFNAPVTFPLRNPQTGEPTGETMTHLDVYKVLYSLYMQTALQRDGVIPPDEIPAGDPGMSMFV